MPSALPLPLNTAKTLAVVDAQREATCHTYLNSPQVQKALHANITALPIVGGYVVGYENVTFVSIRGAGHFVPGYQPQRALAFFSSFLQGNLPSPQKN
ncbi:hypothetical protein SASPL_113024 [Salvia splendens]|uniref:Uncharacterized protein n=1 Tax=Salvia splendens TaxID=180675 RepID=A0A8X8Y1Z1_SALSN|nr:hypothetical protein SASPL_113024 [Salvia splendens]